MRKITSSLFVSLDGVAEAPEKWHLEYFNDEMGAVVGAHSAAADTMLLGRVTYEEFEAYWSDKAGDGGLGDYFRDVPKLVASRTLDSVGWENSTLIKGNVAEELTRLKETDGKNIAVTGSMGLIRSLLSDGVLDELELLVHPVVVGNGAKKLFPDGGADQFTLNLVKSTTFSTGVVHLVYQPA
ncbi:Dihydrofolate reductase [Actinokineospora alba]|uniref:Dihydrofolate reductase n=1 Tax=Actinokineospora alba TaxID=504798 RepID=A0A1H0HCE5_9PSEU|nr:dihydrofolate reductase family protein [Actinokineospora alba]TDP64941.1 dihydrofolate reductase [Actinokineospora alba]SDH49888.1 Dihydrofolate reductase [Actinokineospora alba]SDO16817.1 Dihydrofolate reductase [Actinokineospora alba]